MDKVKYQEKGIAVFEKMDISKNRIVQVKFKMRYDQIMTSISLLQGLNTDITVIAKIGIEKAKSLGLFTIGSVNFDRDGNAVVLFKSHFNRRCATK